MSRDVESFQQLDAELRSFYNRNSGYFEHAADINSEMSPERAALFSWIKAGERVLDVGCGPGDNGVHLGQRSRYFGCDVSFLALGMAAKTLGKRAAGFAQVDSRALPFAEGSFDTVISTYALEHMVFPRESLDEMWRVCRSTGRIILISPAYDNPFELPPSTGHWPAWSRFGMVARQAWRQAVRHMQPRCFYFARIERPRVLTETYQSDFDAVHLVSAREITNYFKAKQGCILYERKRAPRPIPAAASWRLRMREVARNLALYCHIGEYSGQNLQLVVEKRVGAK